MSFRSEFVDSINELYRDDAIKRKSMDMDWRRIQGYLRAFIEDIRDVMEFACASLTESDEELILSAEGRELLFRRQTRHIDVLANNQHVDALYPTVDGFCVNAADKKILEVIDDHMRAAFRGALKDMRPV